jgi:hypothetical protein
MPSAPNQHQNPDNRSRIGTPEHFRWLQGIVKVILIFNLIDALFTILWIYSGVANESNPLLAELVKDYPVIFAVVKFALVSLGSILLWRFRYRPLAIISIFLAFLTYYCLLLYHIRFVGRMIKATFLS